LDGHQQERKRQLWLQTELQAESSQKQAQWLKPEKKKAQKNRSNSIFLSNLYQITNMIHNIDFLNYFRAATNRCCTHTSRLFTKARLRAQIKCLARINITFVDLQVFAQNK
jgi:hypothetical protein